MERHHQDNTEIAEKIATMAMVLNLFVHWQTQWITVTCGITTILRLFIGKL